MIFRFISIEIYHLTVTLQLHYSISWAPLYPIRKKTMIRKLTPRKPRRKGLNSKGRRVENAAAGLIGPPDKHLQRFREKNSVFCCKKFRSLTRRRRLGPEKRNIVDKSLFMLVKIRRKASLRCRSALYSSPKGL